MERWVGGWDTYQQQDGEHGVVDSGWVGGWDAYQEAHGHDGICVAVGGDKILRFEIAQEDGKHGEVDGEGSAPPIDERIEFSLLLGGWVGGWVVTWLFLFIYG